MPKLTTEPRDVVIRDDTLRSGGNTPGVYASVDKKLRIAALLDEMGVREAEVGYGSLQTTASSSPNSRSAAPASSAACTRAHGCRIGNPISTAIADCGGDLVNFVGMQGYTSTNALHPQLTGEAFLERMEQCIAYAKSRGLKACFGTDIRVPTSFPIRSGAPLQPGSTAGSSTTRAAGSCRRRWACWSISCKASADKIEVTVHCHDDFGLATANTLEGIRAGAMGCDTTVNRTGHRCGNAGLEQVAVALEYFYGYRTGIDLTRITA